MSKVDAFIRCRFYSRKALQSRDSCGSQQEQKREVFGSVMHRIRGG